MKNTVLSGVIIWMCFHTAIAQTNTFIDHTDSVGLAGQIGVNAAWGDYNNDGWVDLHSAGKVFRNDSGIAFTQVAAVPGVPGSVIWGDYDNDGLLDVFSYSITGGGLYHNEGNDSFADVSIHLIPAIPSIECQGAVWGDFDLDGYLDLYIGGYETPGYQPDYIYMNNGDGTFSQTWSTTADPDPARGVNACDFDEDGDLDIYVSNYRLEANILWLNDGNGSFSNVADSFGVAGIDDGWSWSFGHSIGAAWGDLDSDGDFDLFGGNFSHTDAWQDRPMFYENLGPDSSYHFADRSATAGLAWQESFASPALADYDNDGYLDLYYSTVYAGDYPVLYRNNGDWTFTDVTSQTGLSNITITYQAAFADFNNDGYIDLITGGTLYKNSGGTNNWLKVNLKGTCAMTNVAAIGAQVRLFVGTEVITRQVEGATGQGNQNDLTLHFGVDSIYTTIDSLVVNWPGGNCQTIINVALNQTLDILEDPIAINLPDSVFIGLNDSALINPNGVEEYSYLWSTGDTTAQITVSPDSSTTYYLTVSDSNCVKTDSVAVVVNISSDVKTEYFTDRVLIYPNPFSTETNVMVGDNSGGNYEIKIFDTMGRIIRSEKMIDSQITIQRGDLQSGIYILELKNDLVYRHRIIVK